MRLTLLEMTQDILSSMDSDEVNSINDTAEALQVATAIKTTYRDIISRSNLPENFEMFELNASLDPAKPTVMYRPQGALSILWLKYDTQLYGDTESNMTKLQYLEPATFTDQVFTYKDQNQNDVVRYYLNGPNTSSVEIVGLNNKPPSFWTSWDDETIIFDSYDKEVDDTLKKSKSLAYGEWEPTFLMEDTFIPDLDPRHFSLLFNESKAWCFAELKQTTHEKAERQSRKGWITLQHQKQSLPADYPFFKTTPDYGRKRR